MIQWENLKLILFLYYWSILERVGPVVGEESVRIPLTGPWVSTTGLEFQVVGSVDRIYPLCPFRLTAYSSAYNHYTLLTTHGPAYGHNPGYYDP